MQLCAAERNYPIHEKELLAIIRALKKWCSNLLGTHFLVYTDHRTLENFNTQCNLLKRQLQWQEFMSQYKMNIHYIQSEDNTVADALLRLPPNSFPDERDNIQAPHQHWKAAVCTVLSISTNISVLASIKEGYDSDTFCQHLAQTGAPGAQLINGLWYIGDWLVIPWMGDI